MAALSKPTVGGTDYAARIGLLFDAFNNGNYQFPSTQVASADPNTLDDYEEGTFTPSLGGTATYTTQIGRYVKIGKLVRVNILLTVNAIGTGSTTVISGMPFAAVSASVNHPATVSFFSGLAVSVLFLAGNVLNNTSTMNFNNINAAGAAMSVAPAIFGNSASVVVSCVYEASA